MSFLCYNNHNAGNTRNTCKLVLTKFSVNSNSFFCMYSSQNSFLGFLLGSCFMKEVMGLGKGSRVEGQPGTSSSSLDILLLQLVIPRLGSLQKYHAGIKFMLLFSHWMPIFFS